ncbi:MAG TPA: hypothetical protein VGZ22_02675 [Isosphaeraceae bacterium]|jgi:hypothetical protein|nr:hypothetical protein [Isosphaeraceae bacterium]
MSTPPATAHADVVEVVLRALERAEEPITAKQLRDQLTGPYKIAVEELERLLEEQASLGRAHRFAPYRVKAHRYWSRDLDHYARSAILKALDKQPRTSSELIRGLKSPLKGCPDQRLRLLLSELKDKGRVRELPTFVRSRTKRISTRPPAPREYLNDALQDIYKKLEKAGVSRDQVNAAALAILQPVAPFAAATPPTAPGSASTPPSPPEPSASPEEVEAMILERIKQEWPQATGGALVPLSELRKAVEFPLADKAEFDAAILRLADRGSVNLHHHDYPGGLSDNERAGMVSDGRGGYYIGVSLRG